MPFEPLDLIDATGEHPPRAVAIFMHQRDRGERPECSTFPDHRHRCTGRRSGACRTGGHRPVTGEVASFGGRDRGQCSTGGTGADDGQKAPPTVPCR